MRPKYGPKRAFRAASANLDIEVDEPDERVLIHGLNVSKVRDTEEQNRRVDGDRLVTVSRRVNLDFSLGRNFLLCRNLFGQHLRRRQHVDCCLVF